ncbi:hypothetical protein OQA88_8066 [Cercophora sp. LCS_1]
MDARSRSWGVSQQQQQQQQQRPNGTSNGVASQNTHPFSLIEAPSHDDGKWDVWEKSQQLLTSTSTPLIGDLKEDRLSILYEPLVQLETPTDLGRITAPVWLTGFKKFSTGQTSLCYTALRRPRFLSLMKTLTVHPLYLSLLEEGSPTALKLTSAINSRPCETYILRTSNAPASQSAICITHFPATPTLGAKTNVLITGYTKDDVELFTSVLDQFKSSPFSPIPFLVAFLEVEKEIRFTAVRRTVRNMQEVIHKLAHEQTGDPSARRKLNKTVELYFEVQHLRTDGLVAWREQLRMLGTKVDGELKTYLEQLGARYDHRAGRCEMVLQGAGLAYQMETTQLSRKDTEIAIGDGKTMKAIAVLTMVFLPGTFIATMLAVPQIEEALKPENDTSFGDRKWLWYIALTIPITVLALLVYVCWECLYKRRYLKSLFGEGGNGEKEDEEKDLEAGGASASS